MNEDKYERHCNECDAVNSPERTECHKCGNKSFARYRMLPADPPEQTMSGPVAERREF